MIVLLITILITSCQVKTSEKTVDKKIKEFETTQELKKFSSVQEIREFLKNAQINVQYGGLFERGLSVETRAFAQVSVAVTPAAKSADVSGATDYSQTNIQVQGVDEADFVKNDNKYIYVITQNKLVIVDAFPADNAKILSETKVNGRPRDMFVNKDRLVIFAEDNDEVPVFAEFDFLPRPRYTAITHVFVYDISDRSNPKLVKDYNLNGNYFQSRMIDNYVYFIVRDNVYYYAEVIDLPVIREASNTVVKPEIYYFDNPEINYNFNTVASFNIFDDDKINAKTFMMGYSNVLYVSQNNIYITYQKNLLYLYYQTHNEDRFYKVVVPLLASDVQSKIESVKNDNSLNSYEKWDKISAILEEMYNKMDEDEKEELIEKIQITIEEYEAKLEQERRKTVIHKIKIDNGEIEYDLRGEVPGYLLNQFSMDEFNNYFRVATTTEFYGVSLVVQSSAGSEQVAVKQTSVPTSKTILPKPRPIERRFIMHNNIYVLDSQMKIVGKIEGIAPDERIYSTRFIGDKLYMVTFKRIDPLFVIDLSNPQKPEILGELKIPGFSDYLHPYDENHIIGVGKETGSNEWGGISIKGVKLALFDVSDVKNPKEIDNIEIGETGSDSEALRDHKAFLFDKKKNILVIPLTEVKGKQYYDPQYGYMQKYWQGAYVFGLTPQDGFGLKGKITHSEGNERPYYYGSPNSVRRALYMDDVLYTVSGIKIKANDLLNISNEIKEVKLPYEKQYYDYPYPRVVAESPTVSIQEDVVEIR